MQMEIVGLFGAFLVKENTPQFNLSLRGNDPYKAEGISFPRNDGG